MYLDPPKEGICMGPIRLEWNLSVGFEALVSNLYGNCLRFYLPTKHPLQTLFDGFMMGRPSTL
jgi:hypothetical protein